MHARVPRGTADVSRAESGRTTRRRQQVFPFRCVTSGAYARPCAAGVAEQAGEHGEVRRFGSVVRSGGPRWARARRHANGPAPPGERARRRVRRAIRARYRRALGAVMLPRSSAAPTQRTLVGVRPHPHPHPLRASAGLGPRAPAPLGPAAHRGVMRAADRIVRTPDTEWRRGVVRSTRERRRASVAAAPGAALVCDPGTVRPAWHDGRRQNRPS